MLASGCAGERPWPAHPVTIASRDFATQRQVTTVDVLPLDLQLWAEPGFTGNLTELRAGAEVNIMNAALDALGRRDFTTGAMIDWNGDFPGGTAMSRDDVLATVGSLAHYGAAAAGSPGQLPVPFLPARLGATTGADATLYLGGWAYVTERHPSAGEQILEGIVIALLVVTVVALIAAATKSDSKSSHGTHHGGRGGDAVGKIGRHPAFTASRGVDHIRRGPGVVAGMVDAFGRTAINVGLASLEWGIDPALPHEGGEAQMYLEMTLVDNRTGLALWHARQLFPANVGSAQETSRVARAVLDALPGPSGQAVAAAQ
jgi:hypothetical protein